MSDVKAPTKGDAGSKKSEAKKPEAKKPEAKKPEAEKSATAAETSSADKSAGKIDAAPTSASQSSISHFSSVSTPAYRSGWNNIFGSGEATKNTDLKTTNGDNLPDHLEISDDRIDTELRHVLHKAFQKQAQKQGFNLDEIEKSYYFEYKIDCNIRSK